MMMIKCISSDSFVLTIFIYLSFQGNTGIAAAPTSIATVKCSVSLRFTEEIIQAMDTCAEKQSKEEKDEKKEFKPYPRNATLEEFDYDDKCLMHCTFKTAGVLTKEDAFPDKSETLKLFTKGKMSDAQFSKITSIWDTCLDDAGKIAKEKKLDKCKSVLLQEFCFIKSFLGEEKNLEIEC